MGEQDLSTLSGWDTQFYHKPNLDITTFIQLHSSFNSNDVKRGIVILGHYSHSAQNDSLLKFNFFFKINNLWGRRRSGLVGKTTLVRMGKLIIFGL